MLASLVHLTKKIRIRVNLILFLVLTLGRWSMVHLEQQALLIMVEARASLEVDSNNRISLQVNQQIKLCLCNTTLLSVTIQ